MGLKKIKRKFRKKINRLKKKRLIKKFNNNFRGFLKGPRLVAPPKIRKWINANSNKIIDSIVICRKPVQAATTKLANIITGGQFFASLDILHYDDMFHLYLYIKLEGKTWRIEKNEIVTLNIDEPDKKEDCIDIPINKTITLSTFMDNGKAQNKKFWSYHPRGNNCQDFAINLLLGNDLITRDSEEFKFIKQDAKAIFKNNPRFLRTLGKVATDLAGAVDVLKEGK